jgi:hypothetical protein
VLYASDVNSERECRDLYARRTFRMRVNICQECLMNRKMKIPMLSFQRESDGKNVRPVTGPLAKSGKMENIEIKRRECGAVADWRK